MYGCTSYLGGPWRCQSRRWRVSLGFLQRLCYRLHQLRYVCLGEGSGVAHTDLKLVLGRVDGWKNAYQLAINWLCRALGSCVSMRRSAVMRMRAGLLYTLDNQKRAHITPSLTRFNCVKPHNHLSA